MRIQWCVIGHRCKFIHQPLTQNLPEPAACLAQGLAFGHVSPDSVLTKPAGSAVVSPPQTMYYPQGHWSRRLRATAVGDKKPLGKIKQDHHVDLETILWQGKG